jgi:hypothetical protein
MTPKEKAKEMYNKYSIYNVNGKSIMKIGPEVKVFALIAVDEVLKSQRNIYGVNNKATKFYLEVKEELEKL